MRKIRSQKPFTFFLEFLLAIIFFVISATIILQIYAGSIHLHQKDEDQKKAMLFAQNLIESNEDIFEYEKNFDKDFKDKGNYYQVRVRHNQAPYPHYVLEIYHDQYKLVEYEWYQYE